MKKICIALCLLMCLLTAAAGLAEKGQVLKFSAHVLGEDREMSSEELYSENMVNWLVICNEVFLTEHLSDFESLEMETYRGDSLFVIIPPVQGTTESELLEAVQDLSVVLNVVVLSKGARVNADQPVTCLVDRAGVLLMDEMTGDPFTSDKIDAYEAVRNVDGGQPASESGNEGSDNGGSTPDENFSEDDGAAEPEPEVSKSSANAIAFAGETLEGTHLESREALNSSFVNTVIVCPIDALQDASFMDELAMLDNWFLLSDARLYVLVRGSNLEEFQILGSGWQGRMDAFIFSENETNLSFINGGTPMACFVDWDGVPVSDAIEVRQNNTEEVSRRFTELFGERAMDALLQMKGRTVSPFECRTLYSEETVSTESIFSENALTVVNLWSNTCGPCLAEMAALNKLDQFLRSQDARVVGFIVDMAEGTGAEEAQVREEAKTHLSEEGAEYDNYIMSQGVIFHMPFRGTPVTLFIDRQGRVVADAVLGAYMNQVEETVDRLLKK